jgi:hypothetical protein
MAIVINGSGTVTGLAVGGLPDGTVDDGTVASGIASSKLTGALPAISGASLTGFTDAQMPAGSVLQVVQAITSTEIVIGTSYTSCLTVTITPSSSSSRILVKFNTGGIIGETTNAIRMQIKRGSTVIKYSVRYGYHNISNYTALPVMYEMLDSPSTTSAITYTLEALKQSGGVFEVNSAGGTNSMTAIAMEIAG